MTKELFDKVMALDKSLFDVDEADVEQNVLFNSNGANVLYITMKWSRG